MVATKESISYQALLRQGAERYFDSAMTYLGAKQYDLAVHYFSSAIAFCPEYIDAFYWRAAANVKLGNNQQAVDDFSVVIDSFLQDIKKLQQRITQHLTNNYSDLFERTEQLTKVYCLRALVYEEMDNFEMAILDYTHAIDRTQRPELFVYRGNAYHSQGQFKKALNDYDAAIKLEPNNVDATSNKAICLANMPQLH